jgi:ADP-heptose:LPS heptosyltransferase
MTQPIYLPFRGEFGHKIMSVPACLIRQGWHVDESFRCREQTLFAFLAANYRCLLLVYPRHVPTASDSLYLQGLRNQFRSTKGPLPGLPKNMKTLARFIPAPSIVTGIETEIVICPRRRQVAPMRNWHHWEELVRCLSDHRVFAAGAPDSIVTDLRCNASWNYARYLDTTIEAMLAAKLVVATDTGLAHLALLCGRPLLVICHADGLSGPGSHPVKHWRFHAENHANAPLMFQDHAWESHETVQRAAREFMATQRIPALEERIS